MTEGILSQNDCAQCKICCEFHQNSIWDAPGFTTQEIQRGFNIELCRNDRNNLYYPKLIVLDEDLYRCPLLTSTGCSLGENKPFKCAIWPFYVVHHNGGIALAITNVCQLVFSKPDDKLIHGLEETGAIKRIQAIVTENPELIEENKPHFRLLMNL